MTAPTRRTSARRALAAALLAATAATAVAAQAPDFTISASWTENGKTYGAYTAAVDTNIPNFEDVLNVGHDWCTYNGPFTLVGWSTTNNFPKYSMQMTVARATFGQKGSFILDGALPPSSSLTFDRVASAPGYSPDRPIFDLRSALMEANVSVIISGASIDYPVDSELPFVALSNTDTQVPTNVGMFSGIIITGAKTSYGSSLVELSIGAGSTPALATIKADSVVSITDSRPCGLSKAVLSFAGVSAAISDNSMVTIARIDASRCPSGARVPEGIIYADSQLSIAGGSSLLVQDVTIPAGPGGATTSAVAMPGTVTAGSLAGNTVTGGSSATFVSINLGGGAFCPRCVTAGAPLLSPDTSANVYAGAWSQVPGVAPNSMDGAAYAGAGVANTVTAIDAVGHDGANQCKPVVCQPGTTEDTEPSDCSCKCKAAGKTYFPPSCTALPTVSAPAPCTDPNCNRCGTAVNVCDQCFPGFDLNSAGQCVQTCSVPHCLACVSGNPNECAVCESGFLLQSDGTCHECKVPNCLQCAPSNPNECAVCEPPLVLENGQCVSDSSSTTAKPTIQPPTTASPTPAPTSPPRCRVYYCAQCVAGAGDRCAVCKSGYGLTTIRTCVALRPNVHGAAGAASRAVAVAAVAAAALVLAL